MENISDNVLIGELKNRLSENRRALRDLRELTKKLERVNMKLKESEALKSNFLSNIRNEINNPLTSIIGLSEQMATGIVPPEKAAEVSMMIYHEAFELDYQLRNIFMAAELEAGDTSMNISKLDVHNFIDRIVSYFGHRLESKNLSVEVDCTVEKCDEHGAIFSTDPEKLQYIMVNLMGNAIEFSQENKRISIKVWKDGARLFISIMDRGVGIESDKQNEIFDRFKQLSAGARKQHKGHGLGLSIVKSLLDIIGGTVELSSVVGEGTTFTISIPEAPSLEGADIFSEDGNEFIFDTDEQVSEGEVQEF